MSRTGTSRYSPARALRWLALLAVLAFAGAAQANALWFADAEGIHRVDTDSNAVAQSIAQPGVVALALDQKDGSLWALTPGRLFKYGADGATLLALDLKSFATNFNAGRRLALDPSDDSIWVAGGSNAVHLDASGRVVGAIATNVVINDIALAQDESLWVLGRSVLARYSAQGVPMGEESLSGTMQQAAFLAVDDANGALWLAGAKNAFQVALALPVRARLTLELAEVVSGLALDAGTGNAWIAGQASLAGFTKDGAAVAATALPTQGFGNLQVLDFDAPSQSLWLGHEKGISRFNALGQFVGTLAAAVKVSAISAAPSGIVPIVTLVSPRDGALTKNAFEPIRLHYDASCFGQPCNFPSSTLAQYTLTATLDGQSIGASFVFDSATNDAVYIPTVRHAEGVNTLTAFVTDNAGRRSKAISAAFVVDTIAPRFVNVTPPDGTVFTSPGITLQGGLDDPGAHVLLESFSGATVSGANPQGSPFSYAITLRPGLNAFRLSAADAAGNVSTLSLTYSFNTLAITIASPANGATIDDSKVTVNGSFTGATTANITVNAQPAAVTGSTFSAVDVPLHFGANTITVTGISPEGARDTRSITVNSTAPSISITSPVNGGTINADNVLVRGVIQGPANSGVTVNEEVAVVDAAGNFYANDVQLTAGSNTLTATVTSSTGKSSTASVTVNASGSSPLVIRATPTAGLAPLTVTFTADNRTGNAISSIQFAAGGPGAFVAPSDPAALFAFTYAQPGTYLSAVTVTDSSGASFSQTIAIQVRDPTQMDAMFRAIWAGMTSALAAGDKATAMTFLNPQARNKFGPVFDALMPNMPAVVASFSPLKRSSITSEIGEYGVRRAVPGGFRIYLIYFTQDSDGVWRIDEM